MKTSVLFGVFAGIALLPGLTGAQEQVTAKITHLVGNVEVRAKVAAAWRPARIGMTVKERWDIRAYLESEADVTFADGTVLKIGENSVVTLSRMKAESGKGTSQSTVKILSGRVWGNVRKLTGAQSEFEFETPTAVASIRGTRLGIEVGKKRTIVDVYEGKVWVRRKNRTAAVMVTDNNRAILARGAKEVHVVEFRNIPQNDTGGRREIPPVDPFVRKKPAPVDTAELPGDTVRIPADTGEAAGGSTGGSTPQPERLPEEPDTGGQVQPTEVPSGTRSDDGKPDEQSAREVKLFLRVSAPENESRITEPLIIAKGRTVPGAKVFINEIQVAVGSDGSFTGRVPLPDEPYTYTVEIRSELDGKETVLQRTVTYEPKLEKLFLECSSPVEGKPVSTRSIRITGKTLPHATVVANGIPVTVTTNGAFSGELPLTEQQIGELQFELTARNDIDEVSRSMNLEISGASPLINTSAPLCLFSLQGQQATAQRTVPLQLLDRTPGDELTLTVINNGSVDKITSEPGRTENILLNEGLNDYSFQVTDRAGNTSPVIKGKLYYLPGPLILLLNEPSRNPMVYEGVPPVLHPGRTVTEEPVEVEVEIDDGIGTVPLSIKYCRVTGNGQTIQLRNNNNYIYTGKVNVRRGNNQFTVQVEDLTGRLEQLRFEVIVR